MGLCAGISMAGKIQLAAFCGFEFAVGIFWPSIMKMRSQHVPEEMRATIINFFRIPLNLFVCIVLYNVRTPMLCFLRCCCIVHGILNTSRQVKAPVAHLLT